MHVAEKAFLASYVVGFLERKTATRIRNRI